MNEPKEGAGDKPRVTPQMLEDEVVAEQYYAFPGTYLTVCCITMQNGFTVSGESTCVHPDNFNEEIGQRVARADAMSKMWPLLGFRLKDQLVAAGSI